MSTLVSRIATFGLVVASVAIAAPAGAQRVLWWADDDIGMDAIPGALSAISGLTVSHASDQSDFNTQLSNNPWDLVIFAEHGDYVFDGSSTFLSAFLAGGGKILGATWLNDNMATFFDAARLSADQTQISGSGVLFGGVTAPVQIADPGWSVFSQGYSGAGACLATWGDASCAAIEGNGGSTLLLGPLFDTYGSDQANGELFVQRSIEHMLGGGTTASPEPASLTLIATGFVSLVGVVRRRRARARV